MNDIIGKIKEEALKGKSVLYVYNPLRKTTSEELEKRGFIVESQCSWSIQRDNLYYSIYWK